MASSEMLQEAVSLRQLLILTDLMIREASELDC